jgi:hypothetical protein
MLSAKIERYAQPSIARRPGVGSSEIAFVGSPGQIDQITRDGHWPHGTRLSRLRGYDLPAMYENNRAHDEQKQSHQLNLWNHGYCLLLIQPDDA